MCYVLLLCYYTGVALCEVDDAEHADRHASVGIVESERLCQDKVICVYIFGIRNIVRIILGLATYFGVFTGLGLD